MRRPRLPRPRLPRRRTQATAPAPAPQRRGGPLAFLGRGIRSVGYAARDLFFFLGRAPRAVGRGIRGFWLALSLRTRRRLALGVLGGLVAAAVVAFAVPRLPCQFPAGKVCAPDDDAQAIVPADALGYVHVTLDPDGEQFKNAGATLAGLPSLTRQFVGRVLAQVPGPGGEPADFQQDIAPWLGGQAAVAIVPQGGGAEQVQLLEEGDTGAAAEFALSIAAGEPRTADYRGIELSTDARGLTTASVGGFLVIGTEAGVQRVVDVDTGAEGVRPLSDDAVAADLQDELPPERFAEAYVSEDGIESLIASESSPLSSLEPFVDSTTSRGAAASLGSGEGTLEVAVRSSLDPERAKSSPGFFAAFPAFEPQLPERLATDTLGYVGIAEPGTTVSELLAQATAQAPALAESFATAAERLRDLGSVDLEKQLLPSLGGEAAFALQPGVEAKPASTPEQTTTAPAPAPEGLPGGPAPVPLGEAPVPILQFLASGVDSEQARGGLAQLQGPIADALDTEDSLQAPVFDRREVEGVDVQVLRISPTVNLTYALADDQLAVATQPEGVEQVIKSEGGLSGSESYSAATEDFGDEVSLLAYLDLEGLVELGEREGLGEDPVYAVFAPEIRRLRALGLAVDAEPTSIATDARLVIEEGPEDTGGDAAETPSGE
jgi:hypothetical protein